MLKSFRKYILPLVLALIVSLPQGDALAQKGMKGARNYKKNGTFNSKKNGSYYNKKRKSSYKGKDSFRYRRNVKGGSGGDVFVSKKRGKYGYTNNRYKDRKNYRYRVKGQRKRKQNYRRQKYQNPTNYSVNMRRYIKKRQKYKSQRTRKVLRPRG